MSNGAMAVFAGVAAWFLLKSQNAAAAIGVYRPAPTGTAGDGLPADFSGVESSGSIQLISNNTQVGGADDIVQKTNPYAAISRGFRNNNPGNIDWNASNDWLGQIGSDGRFVIFSDLKYGVRAMGRLLDTYYYRYGLKTIAAIIEKYSPPHENETARLISDMSRRTGIMPTQQLVFPRDKLKLVDAFIFAENGAQPLSGAYITAALNLEPGSYA